MRGLFLAVTTLALAVAAPWLLSRPIFLDEDHVSPLLRRPTIGGVSLESQRSYYFFCLGLLVVAIIVVSRVRRSGLGRSLLAVRDNELAAAAMGMSPARIKLFAFALVGGAGRPGGRRPSWASSCSSPRTASWPPTRRRRGGHRRRRRACRPSPG